MITHQVVLPITFPDNTTHEETFLITQLHPAADVVLELAWLRKWNPLTDWANLTIQFQESLRAISVQLPQPTINPQPYHTTVEEVPDEDDHHPSSPADAPWIGPQPVDDTGRR